MQEHVLYDGVLGSGGLRGASVRPTKLSYLQPTTGPRPIEGYPRSAATPSCSRLVRNTEEKGVSELSELSERVQ